TEAGAGIGPTGTCRGQTTARLGQAGQRVDGIVAVTGGTADVAIAGQISDRVVAEGEAERNRSRATKCGVGEGLVGQAIELIVEKLSQAGVVLALAQVAIAVVTGRCCSSYRAA